MGGAEHDEAGFRVVDHLEQGTSRGRVSDGAGLYLEAGHAVARNLEGALRLLLDRLVGIVAQQVARPGNHAGYDRLRAEQAREQAAEREGIVPLRSGRE